MASKGPADDRFVITLKIPDDMRQRVDAYARRFGISRNAALAVLLDKGLTEAEATTR